MAHETVTTVKNVFGLAGRLIPLGIGLAAQHFGLGSAIWLLLLGPLALLIGLPADHKDLGQWTNLPPSTARFVGRAHGTEKRRQ